MSFVSSLSPSLATDLERCLDSHAYNHYSMKKGNERHLTLILESRVLKLQKMARAFYKVRVRAATQLQKRLKTLFTKFIERKNQKQADVDHQQYSSALAFTSTTTYDCGNE